MGSCSSAGGLSAAGCATDASCPGCEPEGCEPERCDPAGLSLIIETARFHDVGLRSKVAAHLKSGHPILCPCPSPGPYVIIATDPGIVGLAKGRSPKQAVGRLVGSLAEVEDMLFMDPVGIEAAKKYLEVERMTCLLPLKEDPDNARKCLERAIEGGIRRPGMGVDVQRSGSLDYGLFYQQHVPDIDDMCSQASPLFCSSGNAHGLPLGQSFQDIISQFKTVVVPESMRLLAIDGDLLHDVCLHASTSMIRIAPDGHCKFVREGYHHIPRYMDEKNWRLGEATVRKWRMAEEKRVDQI